MEAVELSEPLVHVVIPLRAYAEDKKQRPYTDRVTGKPQMGPRTDEPRQKAFKQAAAVFMRQAMTKHGHKRLLTGPLRVLITRRRPCPAKPGQECPDLRFDTSRPDWDNVGKLVGDAGTGVLWVDDRMIVEGTVRKEFGKEWALEITVWSEFWGDTSVYDIYGVT
jgi:Holliday junction resolvase RusA-like endonuclease